MKNTTVIARSAITNPPPSEFLIPKLFADALPLALPDPVAVALPTGLGVNVVLGGYKEEKLAITEESTKSIYIFAVGSAWGEEYCKFLLIPMKQLLCL